jgi:transcriptional regulator with XRE-family HTH domain
VPRTTSTNLTEAEIAALPTELARWMARRKITCEQLAELVTLSAVYISRIRNCAATPSVPAMQQIERVTRRWDIDHKIDPATGVPATSWVATTSATPTTSSRARVR